MPFEVEGVCELVVEGLGALYIWFRPNDKPVVHELVAVHVVYGTQGIENCHALCDGIVERRAAPESAGCVYDEDFHPQFLPTPLGVTAEVCPTQGYLPEEGFQITLDNVHRHPGIRSCLVPVLLREVGPADQGHWVQREKRRGCIRTQLVQLEGVGGRGLPCRAAEVVTHSPLFGGPWLRCIFGSQHARCDPQEVGQGCVHVARWSSPVPHVYRQHAPPLPLLSKELV